MEARICSLAAATSSMFWETSRAASSMVLACSLVPRAPWAMVSPMMLSSSPAIVSRLASGAS
ncbi:hypothetical protein [Cellulomonas soli]